MKLHEIVLLGRVCALCFAGVLLVQNARAEPIPAREKQGSVSAYLVLKSTDGKVIAVADQVQTVLGNQVHSHLTFRFHDGSIDDETSVFTQGRTYQLVSDHHIQKGPSFPKPLDVSVNVATGTVTSREMKDGKEKVESKHLELPNDLANGMTSLIVENFPENCAEMKVSYLAGGAKPRIVTLSTRPDREDTFRVGGMSRRSRKYRVHIDIGGVTGMIAPLIGKQPPDIGMWVTEGDVPTFLKMEGPLYEQGPIWTTEQAAPVWPGMVK